MADTATILHVDDDEANRYAITRLLTKAGYSVIEAASGGEALKKVASAPDLIILDIRLPDISGFDVCRRIKADPHTARIPVLHLSASFTTSDDKAFGLDGGADAYLVRPVESVELIATVGALLRTRRMEEALRQSEDRYRQIVDNVQDFAIFTTDENYVIHTWNAGAQRLIGYPEQEIVGQKAEVIYTPEDRAAKIPEREFGVAASEGRAPDERWHLKRDGSRFFAIGVVTPLHDMGGQLIGFSKLMQDMTSRVLAEQELQRAKNVAEEAQRTAEQANRLKDEFLATLSHELRTPLNAIVGWAQLLRSPLTEKEDFAEGLATIERNAKVQSQLIEDLLDVSRIISGKLRLDMQRLEILSVIDAAIDSVAPAAAAKQINLLRTISAHGRVTVAGDASRLQQVVWNLLSNAIKFTPTGGRVEVALKQVDSYVVVEVSDSGVGIKTDFLPYVFDRFRQADATSKRHQAGLGLGLAIVKQLVELHGGTVVATSNGEGKGAMFTVTLPLSSKANSPEPSPLTSPEPLGRKAMLSGVKMLIVEDDPDSRKLLSRMLKSYGASVTDAGSVPEALQQFEAAQSSTHRFDVIVSDIGMPLQDGYDLIGKIRARSIDAGGRVPAVALTAFARQEDRTRALLSGFQAHVPKPTDADELVAVVASLTGRTGMPS